MAGHFGWSLKIQEVKMSQNIKSAVEAEKKERIPAWLYPSTLKAIDKAMYQANCKSRSEFLENAAQMYAGYISADSAIKYLPAALVSALRATVQCSEDRISRLLFKQTVELNMMMNVLAAGLEIDDSQLDELRWRCVQNVKKTNGSISFADTLRNHNNGGFE